MDIYFEKEYAKLYEKKNEKVEIFKFETEEGKGTNIFIKREILLKINNKSYYDIITPYGYGGPIFEIKKEEKSQEFINEYCKQFSKFCLENDIVSEFIRFHPLEKNYEKLKNFYNISYISDTIFMDLSSEEDILKNITSKTRNMIRKAIKNNLIFEEDKNQETLDTFQELYYLTMKKNKADEIYYFDSEYFQKLFSIKGKVKLFNIKLNDEIIASSTILIGDEWIHYHLSANTELGYKYAANNFLLYSIALWGSRNGFKKFHLGGGYGGNESSLFKFKKSMNEKGVLKFCIGKKIYNEEIYNKLIDKRNLTEEERENNYFPLYRI